MRDCNQPAFILQHFLLLWFSSNWFDCNCCSQHYTVTSSLVCFPAPPHPHHNFLLLSPVCDALPPCWGDLPCLLTDNSDRKLLHVITLLKSQFTQPQQIILRWVPGVMETVFSTLHPASPAPPKPRRSFAAAAREQLPFLPPPHLLFLPSSSLRLSSSLSFTLGLSSGFQTGELRRVSSGWHCLLLNWTLYR